jgi:hypothetical protein
MKRRKRIKRRSTRKILIEKCEALIRQILIKERGTVCQIYNNSTKCLGLFHVLPKGRYPRLYLHRENLLIAGWFCCHLAWHNNYYNSRDRIEPRLKQILGDDYEERLKIRNLTAPKLTMTYLHCLYEALKRESRE